MSRGTRTLLKDPTGKVREVRHTASIKTSRVEAFVRTGPFRRESAFAWTISDAEGRLVDRLVGKGWEVIA